MTTVVLEQETARAEWAALTEAAERVDKTLASLPYPTRRTPEQRDLAEAVKNRARALRARFLDGYGDAVYDRVTEGRTRSLRIDDNRCRARSDCSRRRDDRSGDHGCARDGRLPGPRCNSYADDRRVSR